MTHNLTKGRMDDFFILRMGKTPPRDNSDYWLNGTNNWMAISDMGKSKYISSTSECITDKGIADCNMVPVPANTVVMSFKLSIGKTAITSKPIFTNEAIMSFLPKTEFADNILVDYIYYYLLGHRWGGTGKKAVMGVTLNKASLSATPFSFPSLADQKQAIAELDKINETIEDCRELLRNLDALGQSLFYDYFGDPITNPYNFPKSKLDQLCNIVGRIGFRGYTRNDLVEAGQGAITLSPTNIVNGVVTYDKNTYISWDKYDESPEIMIFDGDVLLTKTGSTVGKIGIVKTLPEKATINPQLVVLKNLKLNNWYITFTLRNDAYQEIIREKSGGSAVPTISQKILGTISLPVPPLELQEKFAERIEQIEAQKKAVEQTIAELQTLLDSRMDYWFN